MTENDIQILEKHIRDKMDSLQKDIESYHKSSRPVSPDNAIGRLTRMEAINSKSINEAALQKAKHTFSKLEYALTRINDPDFGLCRECDEPIKFGRLKIMPETDICVKCAEKLYG
ncbi:MAG: Zinc finger, DksA/TraR C4-type [Candidatus Magnetoglobus multicellularis str. Araruama]|uniref:Zinc finger, DksA/TraR C4-type n=1 Tax=Candidatus Magnetoglobus multicellularis str. Araruama TaxID=890399 RepID=A0A1V1PCP0_9BACT|nr:MAG: Zinc finger, DksA/TraR C4-type [Candidatus Magnetoglobus multicellularis str. Araruama]